MKTAEFNKITQSLKTMLGNFKILQNSCSVDGKVSLGHLTVDRLNYLRGLAMNLQSTSDRFLTADLYHLIGMGNLSASQAASLNKLVKELTSYRPLMKSLAGMPFIETQVKDTTSYEVKVAKLGLTAEVRKS